MTLNDTAAICPYSDELHWPAGMPPLKNIDDDGSMAEPYAQYAWMRKNSPVLRLRTDSEDIYVEEFFDYLQGRLEELHATNSKSVAGHLARAWKEGDITAKEARELCAFLFMAGHDTTTYLIGNGLRVLIEHPDLLDRIKNQPADAAPFVEEVARLHGPVHRTHRRTTEETVIGSARIPAHAVVRLANASANRDDAKFTDPECFDVDRDNSGHLGFGFGVHSCIGAPLARLEARTLFRTLARQVSRIELSGPDAVRLTPGHAITLGPTRLSITVSGVPR